MKTRIQLANFFKPIYKYFQSSRKIKSSAAKNCENSLGAVTFIPKKAALVTGLYKQAIEALQDKPHKKILHYVDLHVQENQKHTLVGNALQVRIAQHPQGRNGAVNCPMGAAALYSLCAKAAERRFKSPWAVSTRPMAHGQQDKAQRDV